MEPLTFEGYERLSARFSRENGNQGVLRKSEIRAVVRANLDGVRACYEWHRRDEVGGRLTMVFSIAPDGHVEDVVLKANETLVAPLPCCVSDEIRTWRFPPPTGGGYVLVTYPFVISHASTTGTR